MPEPVERFDTHPGVTVLVDTEPGINISRWWNRGLDWIQAQHKPGEEYEVLCLESDARLLPEALTVMRLVLREYDLAMVGPDRYGVAAALVEINRELAPVPIEYRIPGVSMLVAGELGLRFDEQFRWFYADDDFEWQHRRAKGTGLVGGLTVDHGPSRPLEGERAEYAPVDLQRFIAKWGSRHIR